MQYLGHIVSDKGVQTDPDKISALRKWPVLSNIRDLRSFFGFAENYRRFVCNYAQIVKPLNNLLVGHPTNKNSKKTKTAMPWIWGPEQQQAFDLIIEKLTSSPVLAYADYSKDRKENPQKLTQLSSRSHPRHLVGKKDSTKRHHHRHHKRQPGEQ